MGKFRWVFIVFCTLWLASVSANDIFDLGTRHFRSVPLNDVRSSVITSIAQSSDGRIWKGSQWGLYYFDGYNYLRPNGYVEKFPAFDRQYIKRIWFSKEDDLYAGTAAAGIIFWDKDKNRWHGFTKEEGNLPAQCSGRVSAFAQAKEGFVWVGSDSGLCLFDTEALSFTPVTLDGLEQRFVRAMHIQRDSLWLGTQSELGLVNNAELLSYVLSATTTPDLNYVIEGISVSSIYSDVDGYTWLSAESSSAHRISPAGDVEEVVQSLPGPELAIAGEEIWLATYSKGLQAFDRKTARLLENYRNDSNVESSLDNDESEAILYDHSGMLWVGTRGHGFNTIVPSQKAFRLLFPSPELANSLSVANVHTVKVMRNGEVWFGSTTNGVDVFDQKKGLVRGYRYQAGEEGFLQGPHILSIDQDQNDEIWLASLSNGVYRYLAKSDSFERYFDINGVTGGRLRQVFVRSNGDIFVAGERGVVIRQAGTTHFKPLLMEELTEKEVEGEAKESELNYSILNMYERANGDIWLNGMDRQYFIPAGAKRARLLEMSLEDGSALPQGSTLGIRDSLAGDFYMYKGGKLLRLVGAVKGKLATFELVLEEAIGKLDHFEDENGIWWTYGQSADTNNWQQRRFSEADGMPMRSGWIFSLDKTEQGTYLYGTPYGVVMLRPELFEDWSFTAPVLISSYTIDGKAYDPGSAAFEFPAYAKSLNFEFSSLDYSFPNSNQYAYRLKGFDEEWTYVDYKNRRATYTNLSPGNYQFEVKATNRLGVWSDTAAVIGFQVLPKWYQTWWFYLLSAFVISCLLILIYRWRVRQLRYKQQELEGLVSYRTQELEASLNELQSTQKKLLVSEKMASLGRLVRGVAHEINTPLGVIKMAASSLRDQAEILHSNASGDIQQRTGKPLATSFEMIGKNIDRIGGLVSTFKELAPDENVSAIKEFELATLIDSSLRSLDERLQAVHCRTAGDAGLKIVSNSSIVHQVLQEIVENALSHAWVEASADRGKSEQAQLLISWGVSASNEHSVFISVEDNGRGISEVDRAKIFDPFYTLHDSADTSGLGLHVAYLKVSQQLSGELRCENAVGGGCCFTMTLPIDPEAAIGETTG